MSVTIDLESESGIAIGVARGEMGLEDIKDAAAALWRATEGKLTRMLWDLRLATFELDAEQVRELAEFIKRLTEGPRIRTAFVVAGDLEFGLVRMFQRLREAPGAEAEVFRDRALAVEWLTKS